MENSRATDAGRLLSVRETKCLTLNVSFPAEKVLPAAARPSPPHSGSGALALFYGVKEGARDIAKDIQAFSK